MQIDFLKNQPQFIDAVAKAWQDEWSQIKSKAGFIKQRASIRTKMNDNQIPFVMIAFEENVFIGSAALFEMDLERAQQFTPWLAGVFIQERFRGKGIAKRLVQKAVIEAKRLGYNKIYLHTETAQGFYEKLGCTKIAETKNDFDEPTTVYSFLL